MIKTRKTESEKNGKPQQFFLYYYDLAHAFTNANVVTLDLCI